MAPDERQPLLRGEIAIICSSIGLGLLLIVVDAWVDSAIFYEQDFLDLLYRDVPPPEMFMRLVILSSTMLFGLVVALVAHGQKRSRRELRHAHQMSRLSASCRDALIRAVDERWAERDTVREICSRLAADGLCPGAWVVQRAGPPGTRAGEVRDGRWQVVAGAVLTGGPELSAVDIDEADRRLCGAALAGGGIAIDRESGTHAIALSIGTLEGTPALLVVHAPSEKDLAPARRAPFDRLARDVRQGLTSLRDRHLLEQTSAERGKLLEDLDSRVRQLDCLYRIARILADEDALSEIVACVAREIPLALGENTQVRVELDGCIAESPGFTPAPRTVEIPIQTGGEVVGRLESVGASAERKGPREGEHALLHTVAERLGAVVEQARSEASRSDLQEQIQRARQLEAVGLLAGGVAHDIGNLLTAISGYTAILREEMRPSDESDSDPHLAEIFHIALDGIDEALAHAGTVTRGLLTFGGRTTPTRTRLDLRRVVAASCRLLSRVLPATIELTCRGVPLSAPPLRSAEACEHESQPDDDAPIWIVADEGQLQQVVLNLAINARDAMPAGGRLAVEVACSAGSAWAVLTLEDDGEGMSREVLQRIFEPFFSTKPKGHGSGLGLSTVHGVVHEHGGRVEVDSQLGRGSRFTVHLPTAEEPAEPDLALRPARGERIRLHQRDRQLRGLIVTHLQELGYHVELGDGPTGGLATPRAGAPPREGEQRDGERTDLWIIDVEVDGISPPDLREWLDSIPADLPVLAIDQGSAAAVVAGLGSRVEVLEGPFTLATLGARVGALLAARPRAWREP